LLTFALTVRFVNLREDLRSVDLKTFDPIDLKTFDPIDLKTFDPIDLKTFNPSVRRPLTFDSSTFDFFDLRFNSIDSLTFVPTVNPLI
ncbi:hypothetical protein EsDP_00007459, partial [Epichloe bromicola]